MKKNTLPTIGKKDQQHISKRQKEFNRRIKKVNALKAELEDMEKSIPEIRSYYQQQIVPVQDKIAASRLRFVKLLDAAYDMKYFRSKEKEKIREILLNHAYELITHYGKSELEPLYDRHSEISYQEEKAAAKDMSRDMAEDMFKDLFDIDVDLEGVDLDDIEEIGSHFQQQAKARQDAQQEQEAQQKQKRKKTKAQQAKEERQAKEAKSISKTTREIYMKLVREFHPDRETDEQKQAEMTEKMQRITEAYKNDDFYELLRLEMELLQGIDERLDELSEQQLKLYNKLLKEQEDELSAKLQSLEFMPSMDMPAIESFAAYLRFKKYAPHAIDRDRNALKEKLRMMKNDIKMLGEKQNLRDFLRDYEMEEEEEMDLFFPFDEFEDKD